MKSRTIFFCMLVLLAGDLYSQGNPRLLFRNWKLNSQGSFQIYTQQQFIQFSRYMPQAPCRIDSIYFHFYSPNGGAVDLVFNIWENSGGYNGPYLLKQLTDSVVYKMTLDPGKQQGYTWKLNPPLVMATPRPFCVGIRNRDLNNPIGLGWSTISQTPSCAQDSNFFTSAYGYWTPIAQGSQTQTLIFSGYFRNQSNQVQIMGDYLIDVFGQYFNVVGQNQKTFRDVTSAAGLTGASGRGIVWGDYNDDGHQDLLMTNKIFRNKGDGTFEDVTATVGYDGGSTVNLFVDVDNDGDLDIICQPENKMFINANGTFTKKTSFGFEISKNTTTVTAADYDNDKYPDVFVGNWERGDLYVKNPRSPGDSAQILSIGYKSYLYKNNKDNTFSETTNKMSGYMQEVLAQDPYIGVGISGYRVVYGSGWSDFDNDGDQDLFVGCYRFQPNYLFVNRGNGSFTDDAERMQLQGHEKPTNTFAHTIGSDWGDYNNDGNMDILVSNFSHPDWRYVFGDLTGLYKNSGPPSYTFGDQQANAGIYYEETHSDVAWGDFNNDGLLDFYITATYSCRNGTLYMQDPAKPGTFIDVTYPTGTKTTTSWGVAWVDFDSDGDLDLSVTDGTGFHLFRNETVNANRWTELRVKSTSSNVFGIGTRVYVYAGGQRYMREVEAGKGSGSQNPYAVHVGLGSGFFKIDSIAVRWSSGVRESWKNVPINTILDVTEGGTLPTGIAQLEVPKSVELYQNFPNPFSFTSSGLPSTSITYDLSTATQAKLEIYDMLGGKVKTLINQHHEPGTYTITWNGTNDAGEVVAGGTYMYILTVRDNVLAKPMMLLK